MFTPILHNTNNKKVRKYNKLIANKPKDGANLQDKINKQTAWKMDCIALLAEIRRDMKV